ncbi:MmyB family transcriptional regulator [Amycolatopsis kentuckyensis]|uniref:MmyB family transcriptional regulator n=1 Tax=Amycolatopsis kentuckyensis TaxID=218823 RepID=UPI003568F0B2
MARLVFLDAHTRDLYPQWTAKAKAVVGNLRLTAGRHGDDQLLNALIGELVTKSPEFAAWWADHRVQACAATEYAMRHPLVGDVVVHQQAMTPAHAAEQTLVVATSEPGSPSQAALDLLARATSWSARRAVRDRSAAPHRTGSGLRSAGRPPRPSTPCRPRRRRRPRRSRSRRCGRRTWRARP